MREKDKIDNFTSVPAAPGPVPGMRMTEQYVLLDGQWSPPAVISSER